MPLIVISGYPCSGKSTRAKEVEHLLKTRCPDKDVYIVTDDLSAFTKNELYQSSANEKTARADLKSKVERYLTQGTFVILDSLNYIKGFRYELYCVSKHVKSTHCILQCGATADEIKEWNKTRPQSEQYCEDILDALVMRYEPPESRNRWDSPLFFLTSSDPLPADGIIDALVYRKPPPPNLSTQNQPLSSVDFLHELDRRTQSIVSQIMGLSSQGLLTGKASISGTDEHLELRGTVTMAELRRKRHQFTTYTKLHPVEDVNLIATLFVQYLNNST